MPSRINVVARTTRARVPLTPGMVPCPRRPTRTRKAAASPGSSGQGRVDGHTQEAHMDKITPCLWFDGNAEDAARFYTSLIPNSRIIAVNRSPADTPSGPKESVLTVDFTLA